MEQKSSFGFHSCSDLSEKKLLECDKIKIKKIMQRTLKSPNKFHFNYKL